MRILAIETSCDETAIAVLEAQGSLAHPKFKVLSNIVSSQVAIHKKFGGVVPNLAKREHQRNLVPVLITVLKEAGLFKRSKNPASAKASAGRQELRIKELGEIFSHEPELLENFLKEIPKITPPTIDAIAVTYGPGLAPALWTGVNLARGLSLIWQKSIIPVNHLEGHIYVNLLRGEKIQFPALALIVSGGHTELVLMKKHGSYIIIGETRDDAAGEAFDKVARLMKLGYPGGPAISALADKYKGRRLKSKTFNPQPLAFSLRLPRPMINSDDFGFSFSGLKTAVLYFLQNQKTINHKTKIAVAREFQDAVVEVLVAKTIKAAKKFRVRTIILGGGVAANKRLRENLKTKLAGELPKAKLLLPQASETTDNALMIAAAAFFRKRKRSTGDHLRADPGLRLNSTLTSFSSPRD